MANHTHNGKVYQYDLKGNFINEYPSQQAASDLNNVPFSYISDHIKGKFSFCKGHIYTKKYYIKLPPELLEHKSKRIYKRKEINQYSLDGKYINSFKDKNEAAEFTGLKARYIRDCASGNLNGKTYGGFIWSFEKKKEISKFEKKKNYRTIHQYSKDGKFIKTFNSLKEASKELNILSSCISHCANKNPKFPSYGGFIWRYEKEKNIIPIKKRIKEIEVYKNNKLIKIFESQQKVFEELNISKGRIWECVSGKRKDFKGYVIKYKDTV
jgi:hypothetical protein